MHTTIAMPRLGVDPHRVHAQFQPTHSSLNVVTPQCAAPSFPGHDHGRPHFTVEVSTAGALLLSPWVPPCTMVLSRPHRLVGVAQRLTFFELLHGPGGGLCAIDDRPGARPDQDAAG